MRTMYLSSLLLLAIVLWEHTGKKLAFTFRPSVALSELVVKAQSIWKLVGIWAATISSFLTYIDLGEIGRSACDIIKPLIHLIISPVWFFKGYFETVLSYATPHLIPIGSGLLILTVLYVCYYFNVHKKIYETRACRILCRLCFCDAIDNCLRKCWHELTKENQTESFNGRDNYYIHRSD